MKTNHKEEIGKMKQKDIEIIKHMRKGGRLNISEVARQLNLPITTVSDRIRAIEKKYMYKRLSLLDYPKIGYMGNAKIAVKINQSKKHELLEFLKTQQCINSIYHINNGFDFLVEVVCKDAVDLKNWVAYLEDFFELDLTLFQILKVEEKEMFTP